MKCETCECYEPFHQLDSNLDEIKDKFEDHGECKNELALVVTYEKEWRYTGMPPQGGILVQNGFMCNTAGTEMMVSESFGCVNHRPKYKDDEVTFPGMKLYNPEHT